MTESTSTDVLVVGGGPAGAAAAIGLARSGHSVTLLERRTGRSPFTRGDLLDPAAVRELRLLGLSDRDLAANPLSGVRMWAGARSVDVPWPNDADVHDAGDHRADRHLAGVSMRRSHLNAALLDHARRAGVEVVIGCEALTPIVERGFVRGAVVADTTTSGAAIAERRTSEIRCRFLVIADGANSRFGRGLGTNRDRNWPYAVSASSHFESGRSTERWVDAVLGPPDRNGNPVVGHGWVVPLGDGGVNVGVTMLSSYRDVLGVNMIRHFENFVGDVAGRWQIDPSAPMVDPVRRRTPLGGSIRPIMGPTFLVVGDAAGVANPLNSHGVGEALMTGRVAADVLDEALTVGNSTTLQRYPAMLDEAIGDYHKVGRLSARFLGRPRVLRAALRAGIRSDAAMGAALRLATGELRSHDPGGAERAYALTRMLTRFAPSW